MVTRHKVTERILSHAFRASQLGCEAPSAKKIKKKTTRNTNLTYLSMKRILTILIAFAATIGSSAQTYIEPLTRGVVAVPMQQGNLVSWRLLSTDDKNVTFDVLRNGKVIARNLTTVTNFVDVIGNADSNYSVVTHQRGTTETSETVKAWAQPYLSLPLNRPADGTAKDGKTYSYTPNDCSTADIDGDGEYELLLKWDPSMSRDNAHNGYTGDVIIDAYKIKQTDNAEETFLWRINLGKNIRAGAHYTQFMVYDFDGDGKAELICKTAPGSVDGKGKFVTEAATDKTIRKANNKADYVNKEGRILSGPEYLTVFSGVDGHAIHTIYYNPNRAFGVGGSPNYDIKGWGDSNNNPGNRGERFLAGVAFLGGKSQNPSAVMCRGYYTCSNLWAVDFDGKQLSTRWLHVSPSKSEWKVLDGSNKVTASATGLTATAYGQGAHSLAVGDVDGDGCDEIMYGSAAIDHDGSLLYSTGFGHGDAQHLGDLDPDRPGLEYFMVHESRPAGSSLRDARTGEVLFREHDKQDTGRGLSGDIDAEHRGYEFWCSAAKKVHAINGDVICETEGWTPQNFRIYWDGDLQDELIGNGSPRFAPGSPEGQQRDRSKRQPQSYYVAKWNGQGCERVLINGKNFSDYGHSASCNGTKATPCLQADLFGDWREEIVLYNSEDKAHLNIFSTNIPSPYRVTTLMHDHVYRMGVAWQNGAYNQPPHLGYYLPDLFE